MKKHPIYIFFAVLLSVFTLCSCIEDGVSTDSSLQPAFSTDTLKMGLVFTDQLTPTSRFTVYNHGDKILNINSISLRDDDKDVYRLNVDGFSGRTFSNVEIRPNDSIFVFVEAIPPVNGISLPVEMNVKLDFVTLGQTRTVVLNAQTRDVERLRALTLTANTTLTADKPYMIFDSIIVEKDVVLTLEAGAELLFHDSSYMRVKGTLRSLGTAEANVELRGDRNGNVATKIPYEIMSGQWGGVILNPESSGNLLEYTTVKNTEFGVVANHTDLTCVNSRLRNSKGYVLESLGSVIRLTGTELAEAASGIILLDGGTATLDFCTIANNYLFSAIGGAAVQLSHADAATDNGSGEDFLSAEIRNSIIYGIGSDISHGDLTGKNVFLRNCILRAAGKDDDNFIGCLWDTDPLFYTVRSDYFFDYRVKNDSPAIGTANPEFMSSAAEKDRYGRTRSSSAPDLGAYVYVPEKE